MPLGPIEVTLQEDGVEVDAIALRADEMATFDLETAGNGGVVKS